MIFRLFKSPQTNTVSPGVSRPSEMKGEGRKQRTSRSPKPMPQATAFPFLTHLEPTFSLFPRFPSVALGLANCWSTSSSPSGSEGWASVGGEAGRVRGRREEGVGRGR